MTLRYIAYSTASMNALAAGDTGVKALAFEAGATLIFDRDRFASEADAAGLAEVPVADCMISYLHRASEGRVSEIMEGIGAIERFGRRNAGPVTVKAMAGLPLMSDRKSGQPILVRE